MSSASQVHVVESHRVVFAAAGDARWHASIEVAEAWTASASDVTPADSLVGRILPRPDDLRLIGVARQGVQVVAEVLGGPLSRNVDEQRFAELYLRQSGLDLIPLDAPADIRIAAARDPSRAGSLVFAACRMAPSRVFVSVVRAEASSSEDAMSQLVHSVASLRVEGGERGPHAEALRAYGFDGPASFIVQVPAGYMPRHLSGHPGRTVQLELEDRDTLRHATVTVAAFAEDCFASADAVHDAYVATLEPRGLTCTLEREPDVDEPAGVITDLRRLRGLGAHGHVDVRLALGRVQSAWVLVAALGPAARLDPGRHLVHLQAYGTALGKLARRDDSLGRPGDAPTVIALTERQ